MTRTLALAVGLGLLVASAAGATAAASDGMVVRDVIVRAVPPIGHACHDAALIDARA